MRLAPITPVLRFGDGSHFNGTGDGYAMREETACLNPLDVAGDVRRIAHGGASRRHWCIHPGAGLPAMPFPANILDQMVPDADSASADDLG